MNLKPPRIFFGWWIVGASFFIALLVGGVIFYGFTAIFEPIANETGWSYTQISLAASLRGLEVGLLAPFIGILADRWGPKRLLVIGTIFTVAGLILLGRTTSLAMFYGAFVLIAIGMSSTSQTILMTAVANWFRKKAGLASGIALSGFGFGGLLVPVMVRLIELYQWRMTMIILALAMLAIILPLSLLFRHKPEQYGYLPDGQVEGLLSSDNGLMLLQTDKLDIKAGQALKSSTFWRMALAFIYLLIAVAAMITHVMPYLSSIGITKSVSSLVATVIPLMSIGGRLGLGWLGDKFNKRLVVAATFSMMGLGLLCFGYVSGGGTWLLVPCIVLFGIGYGGCIALRASLAREYFGRRSFGTIFGFIIGINMLGSITGPPLAGWVFDNWGSYQGIWFIFAGLSIAPLILVLTIPPAKTANIPPN